MIKWVFNGGEVSGFTAQNIIPPDDHAAVVVLTNQDASSAAVAIKRGIISLLLASDDPTTPQKVERARKIFEDLQRGTIDRTLFTANANSYFSADAVKDFASSLSPLGAPQEFVQVERCPFVAG